MWGIVYFKFILYLCPIVNQKKNKMNNKDIYAAITERIIESIESGKMGSWESPYTEKGIARNFVSKRAYSGINYLLLNHSGKLPLWGTFNQIKAAGGAVKKGTKGNVIVLGSMIYKQGNKTVTLEAYLEALKNNLEVSKYFLYKQYYVFSLEDTTGIEYQIPTNEGKGVEGLQEIIDGYKNPPQIVSNDQTGAYYMPSKDVVNVPLVDNMKSKESHAETMCHELIHSTGHPNRLNREGVANFDKFGSEKYSFEELVAELGAAFLCSHLNISKELEENSAAYMAGWLKPLKNDTSFVIKAAAAAQKAVNHILGVKE